MTDNNAAIGRRLVDKISSQELPALEEGAVKQAKYVGALLNSRLGRLFQCRGDRMPIPRISAEEQQPFVRLVDQILEAKASDAGADVAALAESVDWLVADLYGLTNDETADVADFFWHWPLSQEEEDAVLARLMDEALAEGMGSEEELREILRSWDEGRA